MNLLSNLVSLTPLKKLIASTIQTTLGKYIENIRLEELGLLGGDVVLENLELRRDVVQAALGIPTAFDLSRGFIKELRIHIPWTRLSTQPIEIKFRTIEVIVVPVKRTPDSSNEGHPVSAGDTASESNDEDGHAEPPPVAPKDADEAPSWINSLIKRALANVSITAEDVVLKLDDGTVVLSATLRSFCCHSADPNLGWEQRWIQISEPYQIVYKLLKIERLTVCLDRYAMETNTKGTDRRTIVGFERPILDRLSLSVRVQVPLERWPSFEKLAHRRRFSTSEEVDSTGGLDPRELTAYGSGDLALGYDGFDDTVSYGVERGDGADGSNNVLDLVPVFKLPFPSNCGRAIDGNIRRPCSSGESFRGPFEDSDACWETMLGWSAPPLDLVDAQILRTNKGETESGDHQNTSVAGAAASSDCSTKNDVNQAAMTLTPAEMPIPTLVADVYCAALAVSLSDHQINMLQRLIDLTDVSVDDAIPAPPHGTPTSRPPSPSKPMTKKSRPPSPSATRKSPQTSPRLDRSKIVKATSAPSPSQADTPEKSGWFGQLFGRANGGAEEEEPCENTSSSPGNDALGTSGSLKHENFDSADPNTVTRKKEHTFVVLSVHVPRISFDILRHTPEANMSRSRSLKELSSTSMSVPVFGLGQVEVEGLRTDPSKLLPGSPSSAREGAEGQPVSFVRIVVNLLTGNLQMLSGGGLQFTDMQLQLMSALIFPTGPLLEDICSTDTLTAEQREQFAILRWGRTDAATEATLERSAATVLQHHSLLLCEGTSAAAVADTPPCQSTPSLGTAMELRFVSNFQLIPTNDKAVCTPVKDVANHSLDGHTPAPLNNPGGTCIDLSLGHGQLTWGNRFIEHLHGFLSEAFTEGNAIDESECAQTVKKSVNQPQSCVLPIRVRPRVMHYQIQCSGVTATFLEDGTNGAHSFDSLGIEVNVHSSLLGYSVVDRTNTASSSKDNAGPSDHKHSVLFALQEDMRISCGALSVRGHQVWNLRSSNIPGNSTAIVLMKNIDMHATIETAHEEQGQLSTTNNKVNEIAPIFYKVLLATCLSVQIDEVFLNVSCSSGKLIGDFIKSVFDLVEFESACPQTTLLVHEHHSSDEHVHRDTIMERGLFVSASCCRFGLNVNSPQSFKSAKALSTGFKVAVGAMRIQSDPFGQEPSSSLVSSLPIFSTRAHKKKFSSAPFISAASTIVAPSGRFMEFFRQCSGFRLPRQGCEHRPVLTPTFGIELSCGAAEVDVKRGVVSVNIIIGFINQMLLAMFPPRVPKLPQPSPAESSPTPTPALFEPFEFAITPVIQVQPWMVWLSPHLFISSPRVDVSLKSCVGSSMSVMSEAAVSGGSLSVTTMPFRSDQGDVVVSTSECAISISLPRITAIPETVHSSAVLPDTSIALRVALLAIELDSVKISVLSQCLSAWSNFGSHVSQQKKASKDSAEGTPPRAEGTEEAVDGLQVNPVLIKDVAEISTGEVDSHHKIDRENFTADLRVRKRLAFDDVFKLQGDGLISEPVIAPSTEVLLLPLSGAISVECKVAVFSVVLLLEQQASLENGAVASSTENVDLHSLVGPSSATPAPSKIRRSHGEKKYIEDCPSDVFRFTTYDVEFSSHVSFKHQLFEGLAQMPSIMPVDIVDSRLVVLRTEVHRFAVASLGPCDETWGPLLRSPPLTPLLWAIFSTKSPLYVPQTATLENRARKGRQVGAISERIKAQVEHVGFHLPPGADYSLPHGSLERISSLVLSYCDRPSSLIGQVSFRCAKEDSMQSPRRAAAASSAWPWLCGEGLDSQGSKAARAPPSTQQPWFEINASRESISDIIPPVLSDDAAPGLSGVGRSSFSTLPEDQGTKSGISIRRPSVHFKLRKSDCLFHLPTLVDSIELMLPLLRPRRPFAASTHPPGLDVPKQIARTHPSPPVDFLPEVTVDVQPLRVLVPFSRRRSSLQTYCAADSSDCWSAIDALQWTLAFSASSSKSLEQTSSKPLSQPDSFQSDGSSDFHIIGRCGPMDLAAVTWHRKSSKRRVGHGCEGAKGTGGGTSGLVLEGPAAVYFSSQNGCYCMADERLFGDPWRFTLKASEKQKNRERSTPPPPSSIPLPNQKVPQEAQLILSVVASPVIISCRPDQYASVLRLIESAAAAAIRLAASSSPQPPRFEASTVHLDSQNLDNTGESPTGSASEIGVAVKTNEEATWTEGDDVDFDQMDEDASGGGDNCINEVAPPARESIDAVDRVHSPPLMLAYSFTAPQVQLTILASTSAVSPSSRPSNASSSWSSVSPLLELRTSEVSLTGRSPGQSSLCVQDCSIICWPLSASSSRLNSSNSMGVALFGLATPPMLSEDDDEGVNHCSSSDPGDKSLGSALSEEVEPMLRIDWSTFSDKHSLSEVVAQARPLFLFATPSVLDDLIRFASNPEEARDKSSLVLPYPVPKLTTAASSNGSRVGADTGDTASALGNMSFKFLSREIQTVLALDENNVRDNDSARSKRPALIFTVRHIFLHKKKQKRRTQVTSVPFSEATGASTGSLIRSSTGSIDTFGVEGEPHEDYDEENDEDEDGDEAMAMGSSSSSSDEDEDRAQVGQDMSRFDLLAEDEIMLNALGVSIALLAHYSRSLPLSVRESPSAEDHVAKIGGGLPLQQLETVRTSECCLRPCAITFLARGQVANETCASALVGLGIDSDEIALDVSLERLQLLFLLIGAFTEACSGSGSSCGGGSGEDEGSKTRRDSFRGHSEDFEDAASNAMSKQPLPGVIQTRTHPALVPPPTPNTATQRAQLSGPLDAFAARLLVLNDEDGGGARGSSRSVKRRQRSLGPTYGVSRFHGQKAISGSLFCVASVSPVKDDPHVTPENDNDRLRKIWTAPLRTRGLTQQTTTMAPTPVQALPSGSMIAVLARGDCLATSRWFEGAYWRYHTPRTVSRIELGRLAAPKLLLLRALHRSRGASESKGRHDDTVEGLTPARRSALESLVPVVHFCLERRDTVSGRWLKATTFSAPIDAVDPPPVKTQRQGAHFDGNSSAKPQYPHRKRGGPLKHQPHKISSKDTTDESETFQREQQESELKWLRKEQGWTAWLEWRFEEWCADYYGKAPSASERHRYLVQPTPAAQEWRLLWACPDLTDGQPDIFSDDDSDSDDDDGGHDGVPNNGDDGDPGGSAGAYSFDSATSRRGFSLLSSRVPTLLRVIPSLLVHSLFVASVKDLPMVSVSWRVRRFDLALGSAHAQIVPPPPPRPLGMHRQGAQEEEASTEALARVELRSLLFSVEVPSSVWSPHIPPSVFFHVGRTRVDMTDVATLTSVSLLKLSGATVSVRGLPRLGPTAAPSSSGGTRSVAYWATNALSVGLGTKASVNASPKLLHSLKLLATEYSELFSEPPPPPCTPAPTPGHPHSQQGALAFGGSSSRCSDNARYVLENESNEALWFGQHATSESLCVKAGQRVGYSWCAVPHTPLFDPNGADSAASAGAVGEAEDFAGLLLRFALTDTLPPPAPTRPGAWSEPVKVDESTPEAAGGRTRTYRINVIRDQRGEGGGYPTTAAPHTSGMRAVGDSGEAAGVSVIPLLVSVRRAGLQTIISLRGKYVLKMCSFPSPVLCRWRLVSAPAAVAITAAASTAASSLLPSPSSSSSSAPHAEEMERAAAFSATMEAAAAVKPASYSVTRFGLEGGASSFILAAEAADPIVDSAVVEAAANAAASIATNPSFSAQDATPPSLACLREPPFFMLQMCVLPPGDEAVADIGGKLVRWSPPVLLSTRNGAVLHDMLTSALVLSAGTCGDLANRRDSYTPTGATSAETRERIEDGEREWSQDPSPAGDRSETDTTSPLTPQDLEPTTPAAPSPRLAPLSPESVPLPDTLLFTQCLAQAERAVARCRLRLRSLAAIRCPPLKQPSPGPSSSVQSSHAGNSSSSSSESESGRAWAVACVRPLVWGELTTTNEPMAMVAAPWSMLEVSPPLVLRNDHTEPLVVILEKGNPAEVAATRRLLSSNNTAPPPPSSTIMMAQTSLPTRRGKGVQLSVNTGLTASGFVGGSSGGPPPSPRAVEVARDRLSAKLSQVEKQHQKQHLHQQQHQQREQAHRTDLATEPSSGDCSGGGGESGARGGTLDDAEETADTESVWAARRQHERGPVAVEVGAGSVVAVTWLDPSVEYTATCFSRTIGAAHAAAKRLNANSLQALLAGHRPLVAPFAVALGPLLLPTQPTPGTAASFSSLLPFDSASGHDGAGNTTTPPYQHQLSAILVASPVASPPSILPFSPEHASDLPPLPHTNEPSTPSEKSHAAAERENANAALSNHVPAVSAAAAFAAGGETLTVQGLGPVPFQTASEESGVGSKQFGTEGCALHCRFGPRVMVRNHLNVALWVQVGSNTFKRRALQKTSFSASSSSSSASSGSATSKEGERRRHRRKVSPSALSSGLIPTDSRGCPLDPLVVCVPPFGCVPLPVISSAMLSESSKNKRGGGKGRSDVSPRITVRFGTALVASPATGGRGGGQHSKVSLVADPLIMHGASSSSRGVRVGGAVVIVGWSRWFPVAPPHNQAAITQGGSDRLVGGDSGPPESGGGGGGGARARLALKGGSFFADSPTLVPIKHRHLSALQGREIVLPLSVTLSSGGVNSSAWGAAEDKSFRESGRVAPGSNKAADNRAFPAAARESMSGPATLTRADVQSPYNTNSSSSSSSSSSGACRAFVLGTAGAPPQCLEVTARLFLLNATDKPLRAHLQHAPTTATKETVHGGGMMTDGACEGAPLFSDPPPSLWVEVPPKKQSDVGASAQQRHMEAVLGASKTPLLGLVCRAGGQPGGGSGSDSEEEGGREGDEEEGLSSSGDEEDGDGERLRKDRGSSHHSAPVKQSTPELTGLSWLFGGLHCAGGSASDAAASKEREQREAERKCLTDAFGAPSDFRFRLSFPTTSACHTPRTNFDSNTDAWAAGVSQQSFHVAPSALLSDCSAHETSLQGSSQRRGNSAAAAAAHAKRASSASSALPPSDHQHQTVCVQPSRIVVPSLHAVSSNEEEAVVGTNGEEATVVEHCLVSASTNCGGARGEVYVLLRGEPQPNLRIRNLVTATVADQDHLSKSIEFQVDEDAPFPHCLDAGGGCADYMWGMTTTATDLRSSQSHSGQGSQPGNNVAGREVNSSSSRAAASSNSEKKSSIFRAAQTPTHQLRLRFSGHQNNERAERGRAAGALLPGTTLRREISERGLEPTAADNAGGNDGKWSEPVWIGEGIQMVSLGRGGDGDGIVVVVHAFYRAGSLVVLLTSQSPSSSSQFDTDTGAWGLQSLQLHKRCPSKSEFVLVVPQCTFHVLDDTRPLASRTTTSTAPASTPFDPPSSSRSVPNNFGLVWQEVLQLHCRGALLRLGEHPPEPKAVPFAPQTNPPQTNSSSSLASPATSAGGGGGPVSVKYALRPEEAHVRLRSTVAFAAQQLQVDCVLHGCTLPVFLAFRPSAQHASRSAAVAHANAAARAGKESTIGAAGGAEEVHGSGIASSRRRRQRRRQVVGEDPLPCVLLEVEVVAVHERAYDAGQPSSEEALQGGGRVVEGGGTCLQPDPVLPYMKRLVVALPRKAELAAEQMLVDRLTNLGAHFSLAATLPLPPLPMEEHSDSSAADSGGAASTTESACLVLPPPREISSWVAAATAPRVFLEAVTLGELSVDVTLRIFVPGSKIAANYAADAILRSPALVGSLQLLGSPTTLVASLTRGLRDLVVLPLEALPKGPLATGKALVKGSASFVRHTTGGALASVSGFGSSVTRNLASAISSSSQPAAGGFVAGGTPRRLVEHSSSMDESRVSSMDHSDHFDNGSISGSIDSVLTGGVGGGHFRGDTGSEGGSVSSEQGSGRGLGRRVLGGLGRGLLGVTYGVGSVVSTPLLGAMNLVGATASALSQTVSGGAAFDSLAQRSSLREAKPMATPGGRPLVCPRIVDLWYRAKLLPPEPRIRLLLVADIAATHNALPPSSLSSALSDVSAGGTAVETQVMVVVSTYTRLYLVRRDRIWLGAELSDVRVAAESPPQHKFGSEPVATLLCIKRDIHEQKQPHESETSEYQRITIRGLSPSQRAALSAATERQQSKQQQRTKKYYRDPAENQIIS